MTRGDFPRGRVIRILGADYIVSGDRGEVRCSLRGKFRLGESLEEVLPVVGDDIAYRVELSRDDRGERGLIMGIAPRMSIFVRSDPSGRMKFKVICSNLDYVFIVVSVKNPKLKPRFVDRMIVSAENGKMEPVICINKMDLAKDRAAVTEIVQPYIDMEYRVVCCSALDGTGLEELRELLRGKTSMLVGPSGSGKTSIVNALQKDLELRTDGVSGKTGKGKHTTSHFELHPLDFGGFLVVERQANPVALWPNDNAAEAMWVIWSLWLIGLASVTLVRWARRRSDPRYADWPGTATVVAASVVGLVAIIASWPEQLSALAGNGSELFERWYTDLLLLLPALATAIAGLAAFWEEIATPRLGYASSGRIQLDGLKTTQALRHQLTGLLGDPTARVLFPGGDSPGEWIDEQGHPEALAEDDNRGATIVSRSGAAVAALEYDASLAAEPDLVDIAATTMSLSLEQRSRHALAEQEAAAVRASATRLLVAAEESRKKLRQELAEGPDERLAEVLLLLESDNVPLEDVHSGLQTALDELREIAHGEIPMSLIEFGISEAVADLSVSIGVPVTLRATTASPPSPELVTFYLALADTARNSTEAVSCELSSVGGAWCLEIGGATAIPNGRVADRIETLNGTMHLSGDRLEILIPFAAPADQPS